MSGFGNGLMDLHGMMIFERSQEHLRMGSFELALSTQLLQLFVS